MKFVKLPIAALFLSAALAVASPSAAKEPTGAVLLTVAGDVKNPNRPAYNEKHDVLFKYHEQAFDRAFEFDRAMLEELGTVTVRIALAAWDGPKTFSGPRLVDVLGAAGCGPGPVATLSMDGYATELSPAELAAHEWVLSTRAGGRPHDIGGRGPLWLVYDPPGDRRSTAEEEATWPWQLFFIRCGAAP